MVPPDGAALATDATVNEGRKDTPGKRPSSRTRTPAQAQDAPQTETQVARPLHVLAGLIQKDLAQGREAAERAGLPYYQAAGEKMLEAKGQLAHGEFGPWIKRQFKISPSHASHYMNLAKAAGAQILDAPKISSLRDFVRKRRAPDYQKISADLRRIRDAELKRVEELEAQHKLMLQLIDAGYKALAVKAHPDKGGARGAMSRLNQVRDRLKAGHKPGPTKKAAPAATSMEPAGHWTLRQFAEFVTTRATITTSPEDHTAFRHLLDGVKSILASSP